MYYLFKCSVTLIYSRGVSQAVSRRPLTAEAPVRARVSPCGICGGQSGTWTSFSPSSSVFLCQYHSTVALHTQWPITGRRGWVVSTPASYSGGPRFNSWSGAGYPDCGFFVFSSVPPGNCWDSTFTLGQYRFLPHPFQFIIHLSSFHSTLYCLATESFVK
jgi:hypothetical protein